MLAWGMIQLVLFNIVALRGFLNLGDEVNTTTTILHRSYKHKFGLRQSSSSIPCQA